MIKHLNLHCAGQPLWGSPHQQQTIFDARGVHGRDLGEALPNLLNERAAAGAESASEEVGYILRRRTMPVGVTQHALP